MIRDAENTLNYEAHVLGVQRHHNDNSAYAIVMYDALLTILGYIITKRLFILVTGILTILGLVFLYLNRQIKKKTIKEPFKTNKIKSDFFQLEKKNYTHPTKSNPLMNVLLPEIVDNPKRPPAAPASRLPGR